MKMEEDVIGEEVFDCLVNMLNEIEKMQEDDQNENMEVKTAEISTMNSSTQMIDEICTTNQIQTDKKDNTENMEEEILTVPVIRQVASTRNLTKFFKGCSWSPDGLCIMANNDDNCIRLYNTPTEFMNKNWVFNNELLPSLKIMESGTIYDCAWWPAMNSMYPSTCCLITTSRDQPTHLWDAFDGTLRATYIARNAVDDITAANSVCFSPDGMQLLCGYKKEVRLFYTDSPGSKCELWRTDKQKSNGQSGIISNIAFHPDGTMFACASYDKTIGIYSTTNGRLLDLYNGHEGGITFIKFSSDGNRLFSGGRCDGEIKCWDIRHSLNVCNFGRTVSTNQRIQFDLYNTDNVEKYLFSGNTDGSVYAWNIECMAKEIELNCPKREFTAHSDCVNGVSAHPYLPILATTSGQRHNDYLNYESSDEDEENIIIENKLKFWQIQSEIVT